MQSILSTTRRAILDYKMISDGDKIAIGLSGGKDSMMMLEALHRLKVYLGVDYEIMAISIDPCFDNKPTDFSSIEKFCEERGIEYVIHRSQLSEIIFNIRKEKNPCSLCARMRRGMIHEIAKENGCNKLALGHHKDDVVETFVMNLYNEARIGCFQPVTYLSRRDITVIRPMIYVTEKKIVNVTTKYNIPIVRSCCPADGNTAREVTKKWLHEMNRTIAPHLSDNIFGAIQRSNLDGWNEKKNGAEEICTAE